MYEACSISELKKKIINYETLLSKQQKQNKAKGTRKRDFPKRSKDKEEKKGCYSCGDPTHRKFECPKRDNTVIREDNVKEINCVTEYLLLENRVKGVGGYVKSKSKFSAEIEMDEDTSIAM